MRALSEVIFLGYEMDGVVLIKDFRVAMLSHYSSCLSAILSPNQEPAYKNCGDRNYEKAEADHI
jgi:hypothetical protein